MKPLYDPDTDSLSIDLNHLADGVVLDLNAAGQPVGFDIQRASRTLDLSTLETRSLPTRTLKMA